MRPTTIKRHQLIRTEFNKLVGTMPVMDIYVRLGEQFGMSDEWIRKILAKKHPGASSRKREERPPPRRALNKNHSC